MKQKRLLESTTRPPDPSGWMRRADRYVPIVLLLLAVSSAAIAVAVYRWN